ncbi:MAG: hypothetical protein JWL73_1586 [Actinomycetia bacterium]|nr:hypothetical protein [Actinomycetes bacterium]
MDQSRAERVRLTDRRHGVPRLVARFADLGRAREAMLRLESAGVDGDAIALIGRPAEEAHRQDQRDADPRTMQFLSRRLVVGVVAGALIGAVAGAVVGGIVVAFSDAGVALVMVATIVVGALAGATVGALVSVERSTGFSESYILTFQDASAGPIWLAVYEPDRNVESTLQALAPLELRRPRDLAELREIVDAPR